MVHYRLAGGAYLRPAEFLASTHSGRSSSGLLRLDLRSRAPVSTAKSLFANALQRKAASRHFGFTVMDPNFGSFTRRET